MHKYEGNVMKKSDNKFAKVLGWIIVVFCCCFFLQILAFMIPQKWLAENISESAYELSEGGHSDLVPGYYNMKTDTFTDSWMLNIASYQGNESAIEKAMGCFYYDFVTLPDAAGWIGPYTSLFASTQGNIELKVLPYSRYWHGYIIFLKIALIFLNYSEIKILNSFILISLFMYLFYLFTNKLKSFKIKKLEYGGGVSLALYLMVLSPIAISFCMAYSGVVYISTIAVILLLKKDFWQNNLIKQLMFFVTIGMLTSWIDVLSTPLLTLGIPLIFFVLLKRSATYKEALKNIMIPSIGWGVGYAGMWVGKWILATVILKRNVITEALWSASLRSGDVVTETGTKISGILPITETLQILGSKPYMIIFGITAIAVIVICIYNFMRGLKMKFLTPLNLQLLIIALYPVIWSQVLKNHTYVHWWFTHRIWSISILALAVILFWSVLDTDK